MSSERESLLDIVNRHGWWYHTMDLGHGVSTPGQYGSNLLPVANLMAHLNLEGCSCLDIGTMDGKMAFLLEKLGGEVVTVDVFERATVTDLIDHFSSTVTYVSGIRDSNLPDLKQTHGYFDFVLCAGVLYHIYSPIDLIANVRAIIKNDGYAIFESACLKEERRSYMQLNWGDLYNEHTTIWVPTIACLKNMLRYFGFEPLADAILTEQVSRYAVLCKAVAPSDIGKSTKDPWLAELMLQQTPGISSDYLLPQLDIAGFEAAPFSTIPAVKPQNKRRKIRSSRSAAHSAEAALLKRATPCAEI